MSTTQMIVFLITGVTGTVGFSLMFRIDNKKLVYAALCGLVSSGVLLLFTELGQNQFISNICAALALSVLCELLCRKLKAPVITFLTPGLIPLVPGRSLYYSMRHLIYGEYSKFLEHITVVMQVALGISVGIMLASVISVIFFKQTMLSAKGNNNQ